MRNKRIDVAKGIATFLVLWGHTIESYAEAQLWNDKIHIFIYSFHMPLFMFLSGYVFYYSIKKRWWDIAIKRSSYLFIPILIWGTESFFRTGIQNDALSFENWVISVTAAGLWFLYAVILNNIITITIFRVVNSSILRIVLCIFIFILLITSCEFIHSMRMITYMFPYFIVGVYWNKNNSTKEKKCTSIAITLLACLFPVLLLHYSENAYIYVSGIAVRTSKIGVSAQIINNIYRWVIGFAGIAFFYRMFKTIDLPLKLTEKIGWIGKRSLQFYALNGVVVYWVNQLIKLSINVIYRDSFFMHSLILGITIIEVGIIVLINKCVEKSSVLEFILFGRQI